VRFRFGLHWCSLFKSLLIRPPTEFGFEGRTAEIRDALLQSICFTTGATELGYLGAVRSPFEELSPCDGGRGGPAIKALCLLNQRIVAEHLFFRTDATALGVEWHRAEIRNALLQSMCFFIDATEPGDPGAVGLPFEDLVPCDGGKGGARHQSIVLTAHATCRVSYIQCPGNRETINSTLPFLPFLRLSLALRVVFVAAHTWTQSVQPAQLIKKDK
jgi:hypothetical protein